MDRPSQVLVLGAQMEYTLSLLLELGGVISGAQPCDCKADDIRICLMMRVLGLQRALGEQVTQTIALV